MTSRTAIPDTRGKLLDAATTLIRQQGFAATSVDQVCAAGGVTKGGFFHHFASKEAMGVAAAEHWGAVTEPMFAAAGYHQLPGALDRILAYLDLRETMIDGETDAFTCLAGTLAQEVHQSHPRIARAAQSAIEGHAKTLEPDIAEAIAIAGAPDIDPRSLALHIQAVLQGSFVLAKAQGNVEAARASVRHVKNYINLLCKGDEQ